jgi:hypothetical protein
MKKNILTAITLLLLTAAYSHAQIGKASKNNSQYHSILPGQQDWLDTNGKRIQAHGFSVFYKDGTYYWYGENKEFTVTGSNIWTYGIRCYTSRDFYNWEDRGFIIPPDTTDHYSPLNPSQGLDRPHIIYCPKTGKYVAWIKILGKDNGQFMTVLQADDFLGPYKIVNKGFRPVGFESGDFDLYVDEKKGKGYIWFERPHSEMICATLNDDFTAATEEYSVHFPGKLPPDTREAPAHFVRNGKHYLFTSGTSGYSPNQSLVSAFTDYHGKYLDLGNPHPTDTSHTSFCSQITDVIKIPGKKDLYVALADRWMPRTCGTGIPRKEENRIRKAFKSYKSQAKNSSDVQLNDMTKVKRTDWDVTSGATYVWLPIIWKNGVPQIYWKNEWKLSDFK